MNVAVGLTKSGYTSAAITSRIARIEAMTTIPPRTTRRDEARSIRMRRLVRVRLTVSGRAGGAASPSLKVRRLIANLLDLAQLFFRDRRRDREVPVLDHDLLAFLGEHELHELTSERVERLARRPVHVHVEEARERIAPGVRVVLVGLVALVAFLLGQRDRPHPRRRVADAAVTDGEPVDRDALDDRRRAGLLLHGVLVVAVLERVLLEEPVRTRGGVAAVEADRLRGPVTGEAQLSPGGDVVLIALAARLREDRVDLRQGQALDRVVLVHEHAERVDRRADLGRLVAVLLLELIDLGSLHRARNRPELSRPRDQGRWRRRGPLPLDLDLGIRIELAERLGPECHHVVERVGTDAVDVAADTAGGLVRRQGRVELHQAGRQRQAPSDHDGHRQGHRAYVLHPLISSCRVRANGRAPMLRRHKGDVTNVLRLVLEAVADASYGLDAGLLELRGRELATQARHVDVHRPGLDEAVAAPDHVEQLLAPEHPPGRPHQGGQELELLGRQLDLAALHPDLEAIAVDLQIADLEACLLFLRVGRSPATQHRADPGDQLTGRERLGDVVVGADLEAEDLVPLLDAAADHDHRNRRQVGVLLETPA